MPTWNPNKTTVGELCEAMSRATMPEARAYVNAIRDGLGVVPIPTFSYEREEDYPAFLVPFTNSSPTLPFDASFNSGPVSVPALPANSVFELKRLWVWNPGAKTAAGLVTLTLNECANGDGNFGGASTFPRRNRAASLFFPDNWNFNQAASPVLHKLWQAQLWVPAAAAAAAPVLFELSTPEIEGPQVLTSGLFDQGLQLVVSGVTAGLTGIQGAIEYIEKPPIIQS